MYPFLRLIAIGWKAKRAARQHFDSIGVCNFRAHPWDIDLFLEMNNGRHLTLYDLGRFDLGFKVGLMEAVKRRKWGFVVAGGTVRFRARIRMFDKVTMRTQLLGKDERWFYFQQTMEVDGKVCSSLMVRAGVTTRQGKTVPTEEVWREMNAGDQTMKDPPDWVRAWITADAQRPWPPQWQEQSGTETS